MQGAAASFSLHGARGGLRIAREISCRLYCGRLGGKRKNKCSGPKTWFTCFPFLTFKLLSPPPSCWTHFPSTDSANEQRPFLLSLSLSPHLSWGAGLPDIGQSLEWNSRCIRLWKDKARINFCWQVLGKTMEQNFWIPIWQPFSVMGATSRKKNTSHLPLTRLPKREVLWVENFPLFS